MAPVTDKIDRKRLAAQMVSTEARVLPSSEVALPLAGRGSVGGTSDDEEIFPEALLASRLRGHR